jgi:pilus assembly protein CpaB
MKRRVGLLLAALIVALFGTSAVYAYVNRVEAKTVDAGSPVNVLVAAAQIPAGTTGAVVSQNKLVKVTTVPKRNVPAGALTDLSAVSNKQLAADVFPGEILLAARFTDRTQAQTGALAIPANRIAISAQFANPQRVAGYVVPGSEVAVFDTEAGATGATGTQAATAHTGVILNRVQVIAVGPTVLQTNGSTAAAQPAGDTTILTLALTQVQAEKLVLAQQTGKLYLGLLSDKSTVAVGTGVTADELYH